jgi:hypothetical protein
MPMGLMAERALVGRNTIARVERGDPGLRVARNRAGVLEKQRLESSAARWLPLEL